MIIILNLSSAVTSVILSFKCFALILTTWVSGDVCLFSVGFSCLESFNSNSYFFIKLQNRIFSSCYLPPFRGSVRLEDLIAFILGNLNILRR